MKTLLPIVLLATTFPAQAFEFAGKVVGVTDGDTITVLYQGKKQYKVRLQLMENRITDLKALDGMARLNTLILSQNRVTDLSPLAGVPNLTTLWLSGNQVQDVTPLKELKKLRTVLLQANRVPPGQLEELRKAIPGCRVNN